MENAVDFVNSRFADICFGVFGDGSSDPRCLKKVQSIHAFAVAFVALGPVESCVSGNQSAHEEDSMGREIFGFGVSRCQCVQPHRSKIHPGEALKCHARHHGFVHLERYASVEIAHFPFRHECF